jgi:hypothetical protein
MWYESQANYQKLVIDLTPCEGSECYDSETTKTRLSQIVGFFYFKTQQFDKTLYEDDYIRLREESLVTGTLTH